MHAQIPKPGSISMPAVAITGIACLLDFAAKCTVFRPSAPARSSASSPSCCQCGKTTEPGARRDGPAAALLNVAPQRIGGSGCGLVGEPVDAPVEVGVRQLEGGVGVDPDRVGEPTNVAAAERGRAPRGRRRNDDEQAVDAQVLGAVAGPLVEELEAAAASRGDSAGMDLRSGWCRLRSRGWYRADPIGRRRAATGPSSAAETKITRDAVRPTPGCRWGRHCRGPPDRIVKRRSAT